MRSPLEAGRAMAFKVKDHLRGAKEAHPNTVNALHDRVTFLASYGPILPFAEGETYRRAEYRTDRPEIRTQSITNESDGRVFSHLFLFYGNFDVDGRTHSMTVTISAEAGRKFTEVGIGITEGPEDEPARSISWRSRKVQENPELKARVDEVVSKCVTRNLSINIGRGVVKTFRNRLVASEAYAQELLTRLNGLKPQEDLITS